MISCKTEDAGTWKMKH